jgi:hypothetical protein
MSQKPFFLPKKKEKRCLSKTLAVSGVYMKFNPE